MEGEFFMVVAKDQKYQETLINLNNMSQQMGANNMERDISFEKSIQIWGTPMKTLVIVTYQ